MSSELAPTIAALIEGDRRAIARAITRVENDPADAAAIVGGVHARSGAALLVGVTGSPGVGKSSLVDRMTAAWRSRGRRVAVLAIDPSSPFTGGAVLGDRVRMQNHAGDEGVFVRSMATRGQLGGLARATGDAAVILDAAGFEVVVIETVGVGQAEVEISRAADVTVVVTMPGTGDGVQAIKAGVMEIADLFVVNKADLSGAGRAVTEIEAALSLAELPPEAWRPPVLQTIATRDEGVDETLDTIDRFREHGGAVATGRRRERARTRVRQIVAERVLAQVTDGDAFDRAVDAVLAGKLDPYAAGAALLGEAAPDGGEDEG